MTVRNFDNIQFESLRKIIDPKFNNAHDELTDCYYNKKPFRNYSILTKEQFDNLHGLIFLMRDIEFHNENKKQPIQKQYNEDKYNNIMNESKTIIITKSEIANQKIAKLKLQGYELVI